MIINPSLISNGEKMVKIVSKLILIISLFLFIQFLVQPVLADGSINLDFFYSSDCGDCDIKLNLIENEFINNESYNDILSVKIKDVVANETYFDEWEFEYDFYPYPFVVIKNSTSSTNPIPEYDITVGNLNTIINEFLSGENINDSEDKYYREIDFFFWKIVIDEDFISSFSLPVLTIILGGLDSFNPCAFFILIFLLNLLLYARSRKRMLLIGGIFILFSAVLYAIFMFVLLGLILTLHQYLIFITIIAGSMALILGVINIKDFFFYKKGASLSIPDSKKPGIYKQMRNLVKNPKLTASIIGTIILAATINFYELLCTLGLPWVFTTRLEDLLNSNQITLSEVSTYILFYNIVYVIPLIVIVLLFIITLGKRKLSEWHGQIMKLETGIMLTSFGLIFLFDYKLLENIVTPILLLISSLVATFIISRIWKKIMGEEGKLDLSKIKEKIYSKK
jgi:cytochrome c biogenesis protein CcdA